MLLKVLNIKRQTINSFSLILEKPKNFNFYPGQYLDIELKVKDRFGKTRAFTISSSPTEDFLMITSKKGISNFKKALENLKPEDYIDSSHQAGTFTLDQSSNAVFIAGGVGITPFRSMIKYALDNQLKTPITLIYSNSGEDFLFKEELDAWQKQLKNLTIHYIDTSIRRRLSDKDFKSYISNLKSIYYLAGSHTFVDASEKILFDLGIDETNIRYDRFDGY